MTEVTVERILAVEKAYRLMKERGWGFKSNGVAFGDPSASYTMVGPIKNGVVTVLAVDPDCVKAVQKAIDRSSSHNVS